MSGTQDMIHFVRSNKFGLSKYDGGTHINIPIPEGRNGKEERGDRWQTRPKYSKVNSIRP